MGSSRGLRSWSGLLSCIKVGRHTLRPAALGGWALQGKYLALVLPRLELRSPTLNTDGSGGRVPAHTILGPWSLKILKGRKSKDMLFLIIKVTRARKKELHT